jgi:hypothetical protein
MSNRTINAGTNRSRTAGTMRPLAPVPFAARLAALGRDLGEHGPEPFEDQLAGLAARARRSGRATSAADVLADRSAPRVARERAFAVVSAALVAASEAAAPVHAPRSCAAA